MKKWDGHELKNDRLRAGDELWFEPEHRLLSVRRTSNSASSNLRWLGGDNKALVPFVSNIAQFGELTRLLADAAGLECGEINDVNGHGMRTLVRAK